MITSVWEKKIDDYMIAGRDEVHIRTFRPLQLFPPLLTGHAPKDLSWMKLTCSVAE
jgi:hypothetical protein